MPPGWDSIAPGIEELATRVRFAFDEAQIWLDEERMLLMHSSSLGSLRRQLIDMLGLERARGVLTRVGFASGQRDAELILRRYPGAPDAEMLHRGMLLRSLEGVMKVEPTRVEFDIARGHYYTDARWNHSIEAHVHDRDFGGHDGPVCWIECGHASGFLTRMLGRFVLHKEIECGVDGTCRVIGKPLEDWGDEAADELRYYQPDSVVEELLALRSRVADLTADLTASIGTRPLLPEDLIGRAPAFRAAWTLAERAAKSQTTVLLLGETGVGKEMFARALHQASSRSSRPFVALNCGALPSELLESELFGVERGAYTGAQQSRPGRFERADGGTLFLDEVGELSLSAQTRLLRVLQEGEIDRLGGTATRKIDVRVVAATNVDLAQAVERGGFRKDLYYRLNVYPVKIPPLRERREDIPLLTERFIERIGTREGKRVRGLTDKARHALLSHDWPGNVRELENVVERGLILTEHGELVDVDALFAGTPPTRTAEAREVAVGKRGQLAVGGTSADTVDRFLDHVLGEHIGLDDIEAVVMEAAVKRADGNLSAAARLLGITRGQLAYRLRKRST
ncbi:MAG: sigma 54-interacting transcriptional regulator [Proteobacteria bacterium]|nr:sigma 54-interacting transcriptional regulator [Pseudomonadota bacterium]